VSTTLTPASRTRRSSGTDTTALMVSPYSVSSAIRIVSRICASRIALGATSTTSCATPSCLVNRRAYSRSSLPGAPTVKATQSGCSSRTLSSVTELSSPPESTTPTGRYLGDRRADRHQRLDL